jgi:hypothetical protein
MGGASHNELSVPNEHLNVRTISPSGGKPVAFLQRPDTGGGEHWAFYTQRCGLHLYSVLEDESQEQEAGSQQSALLARFSSLCMHKVLR